MSSSGMDQFDSRWQSAEVAEGIKDCMSKRFFDIALSLFGFVFWLPAFAMIAIAILLEDGPPVFYTQERIGWHGKSFRLWKFRSMIKDAEAASGPVRVAKNDQRITRVGLLLRKIGMDELPQLVNILKGEMSFVGPRSYREFFVKQFREEVPNYDLCFLVRPGLTGMAQVYGRKDTSALQKWRLDMLYIKNRSLWLDVKLILISIWITLRGRWESLERKI